MSSKAREVLEVIDQMKALYESTASWDYKYDRIFDMNAYELRPKLDIMGLRFPEYCDPDTSCEEDLRVYMRALEELRQVIEIEAESMVYE